MKKSFRKMTSEEMNKLILERVPLEERLQAVYLPIVTMDCACYLAEDLLSTMREARLPATKPMSRSLRNCIEEYRADNRNIMHSTLYTNLTKSTKEFYDSLSQNMLIHQVQYQQAMLARKLEFSVEASKMVALTHIVRKLVRFVLELDRNFSHRISELLGSNIHYRTEDNKHCLEMEKILSSILVALNVEMFDLETTQTDLAFKVFKNKLSSMKIWLYK